MLRRLSVLFPMFLSDELLGFRFVFQVGCQLSLLLVLFLTRLHGGCPFFKHVSNFWRNPWFGGQVATNGFAGDMLRRKIRLFTF